MPRDDDALRRLYGVEPGPEPPDRRVGGVSLVWVALVMGLGLAGLGGMVFAVVVGLRPDPVSDRLVDAGVLDASEVVTLLYGTEDDGCLITPDAFVTWGPGGETRVSLVGAEVSEARFPLALTVTSDASARCVFTDDVSYGVFSELLRRGVRPERSAWRPVDPRVSRGD